MEKQGCRPSKVFVQTFVIVVMMVVGVKSLPFGRHDVVKLYSDHYDIRPNVSEPGRHNLAIGTLHGEGRRLHGNRCWKPFEFLQYQSCTFQYNAAPSETITAILVRDNWDDDTGGTGELISGGPYEDYVVVKITSQFSRGLDSTFSVYGVRD